MAEDSEHQQLGLDFDSSRASASPSVVDRFRQSAERRNSDAQFQLAQVHRHGMERVPRNLVEARVWFEASAANGNSTAKRSADAVELKMRPDEIAAAEFRIGEMYLDGKYTLQDYESAYAWFRRSAARGHASAQLSLGNMHRTGTACPASPMRAYAWFCIAARGNSAGARQLADEFRSQMTDAEISAALLELGNMYRDGTEIPADDEEALFWYREAANQGSAEAEFVIGEMYRNGEGVSADSRLALQWYRKAADRGLAQAQLEVGEMYLNGEGTPRRPVDGLAWLLVAAGRGLEEAVRSKRKAEESLTATEVQRARTLSSAYDAQITTPHPSEPGS